MKKKKLLAILLVATLVFSVCLTGCKNNANGNEQANVITEAAANETDETGVTEAANTSELCGGFSFDAAYGNVTADEKAIFEKATAGMEGAALEPLSVIGTQVVAGTNYAFLCKSVSDTAGATSTLAVVIVYADLGGNASVTSSSDFDVTGVFNAQAQASETLNGGWYTEVSEAVTLPDNVQKAFDKALEEYVGVSLMPMAYLGSQVVAGTNYLILCNMTTVTAEPVSAPALVKIYEDLEGNASVEEIAAIDVASYNE